MLLTIIIYLLTNDLHNKNDKWEVVLFIRFSKVIVYENYRYIYIYIYIINKVKWNVKKWIFKFSNFISYVISTTIREHLFLVMINMVSIVRVWLVLNLNLVLWLYLIVDSWFNFLSECNGLCYYTVKFLMFSTR